MGNSAVNIKTFSPINGCINKIGGKGNINILANMERRKFTAV